MKNQLIKCPYMNDCINKNKECHWCKHNELAVNRKDYGAWMPEECLKYL